MFLGLLLLCSVVLLALYFFSVKEEAKSDFWLGLLDSEYRCRWGLPKVAYVELPGVRGACVHRGDRSGWYLMNYCSVLLSSKTVVIRPHHLYSGLGTYVIPLNDLQVNSGGISMLGSTYVLSLKDGKDPRIIFRINKSAYDKATKMLGA